VNTIVALIGAIAAGIVVQSYLTYRQTSAFSAAVRSLRPFGAVAVGGAGRRYRGGKAFVAIAADADGVVTKAVTLGGWTTLARPNDLPDVCGVKLTRLRRDEPLPNVGSRERSALQNAAQTLHAHLTKAN
jgi:DNA-binding transcriptional regulator of glucitol operon